MLKIKTLFTTKLALMFASVVTMPSLAYAGYDQKYVSVNFEFLIGLFIILLAIVITPLIIMYAVKLRISREENKRIS